MGTWDNIVSIGSGSASSSQAGSSSGSPQDFFNSGFSPGNTTMFIGGPGPAPAQLPAQLPPQITPAQTQPVEIKMYNNANIAGAQVFYKPLKFGKENII